MAKPSTSSKKTKPLTKSEVLKAVIDSVGDEVMVAKDVQELAYTYCKRGVQVEFHLYRGSNHQGAGSTFFGEAQTFLTQRLEDRPFHNGCADINPGNSIAPVPLPASRRA